MKDTTRTAESTATRKASSEVWTDDEREAMQEHAREMKVAKARKAGEDTESDVLAKIAEMPKQDRVMAERIHAIVKSSAPELTAKTWYGMPAYARDGKIICFFKAADKFKSRYATFGFEENAALDDGEMWPTSWALTKLTAAHEAKIAALVKKAAS